MNIIVDKMYIALYINISILTNFRAIEVIKTLELLYVINIRGLGLKLTRVNMKMHIKIALN